jgi:DNA-binding CsgD family transcriptional regulator/tetratricopeptide (TPR) repeat protein
LEDAADIASSRMANLDAAALYGQASQHASATGERDRLRLAAARSYHLAGRMSRARQIDEEVATGGDPAQRLAAAIGFEAASWRTGEPGERAIALLRSAMATDDLSESDPQYIRALAALGRASALSGQTEAAVEAGKRSVALARASGELDLLAAALQVSMHHWWGGIEQLRVRAAYAEELTVIADRSGAMLRLGTPASVRCFATYMLGDVAGLERAQADLARAVRATQQPYWRWVMLLLETSNHIRLCDFGAARKTIRAAREVEEFLESGHGAAEGALSLQSFMLRRETGGLEFARHVARRLDGMPNPWRPGVVALATELGLRGLAGPMLRQAIDQDLPRLRASATWPAALSFLGEGAAWLQDEAVCTLLLGYAEEFAGLNLFGGEFLAAVGSADRLIALLKSALARPEVEEHFETALAMDQRMGSPLHAATTHAEWAAHLRRVGAPAKRVEEHSRPARDLAARYDLPRVRRILGPDGRADHSLPDGLTARELDVLRLISQGHSNRDIAATLVISEYTAANHVRSILMKTHSANRTSAAHYAIEHGLLENSSEH